MNTPVCDAGQPIGALAGVLQRLPADLQEQPLLRVHALGFARGDAEELRIEADPPRPMKPPQRVIILPGAAGSGSYRLVDVPAVGRDLA